MWCQVDWLAPLPFLETATGPWGMVRSDCWVGSSKALGLSDQPPETGRANNYKNKRVYFLSKSELRVLGGKGKLETRAGF